MQNILFDIILYYNEAVIDVWVNVKAPTPNNFIHLRFEACEGFYSMHN